MASDTGEVACEDVPLEDPKPRNGKALADRESKDKARAMTFGANIIIMNYCQK